MYVRDRPADPRAARTRFRTKILLTGRDVWCRARLVYREGESG